MKFALGVLAVIILSSAPVSAQSFIQTTNPQTDNQGSLQGSGGVLQGSSPQQSVLSLNDIYTSEGNVDTLSVEQSKAQNQNKLNEANGLLTDEQKTNTSQNEIFPWLVILGIAGLGLGVLAALRKISNHSSNTFVN